MANDVLFVLTARVSDKYVGLVEDSRENDEQQAIKHAACVASKRWKVRVLFGANIMWKVLHGLDSRKPFVTHVMLSPASGARSRQRVRLSVRGYVNVSVRSGTAHAGDAIHISAIIWRLRTAATCSLQRSSDSISKTRISPRTPCRYANLPNDGALCPSSAPLRISRSSRSRRSYVPSYSSSPFEIA